MTRPRCVIEGEWWTKKSAKSCIGEGEWLVVDGWCVAMMEKLLKAAKKGL